MPERNDTVEICSITNEHVIITHTLFEVYGGPVICRYTVHCFKCRACLPGRAAVDSHR